MASRISVSALVSVLVPALAILVFFLGSTGARAQSIGPDEAVKPDGAVSQQLALTAAQRTAIYNAVVAQRPRVSSIAIPGAVGAAVSPTAQLSDLPDQTAADNPWAAFLKYAMVEDDVVVIDPVRMRVVDIIHGGVRP